MGILNVTPDSFSDGGLFADPAAAISHARRMVEQGAEILDIGGESTRPGAEPVPEDIELARILPVISALAGQVPAAISVDTRKPAVARAALSAGADLVNDVAGHTRQPGDALWAAVAEYRAGYILMHARGTPQTMQQSPAYSDVVRSVDDFFTERLAALAAHGIPPEQVVLDPGIGFGKTPEHNLELLAALPRFGHHGRPLLAGVSRKSFIEKILGAPVKERLPASLACATLAVGYGVRLLRVHDVAETVQAVRLTEAILARQSHVA